MFGALSQRGCWDRVREKEKKEIEEERGER